jgi:triacylglycerol lipase
MPRFTSRLCASLLALTALASGQQVSAANNYPVVLVHGFLGFGPDQFKETGFKYWGGFGDIVAHMQGPDGAHAVFAAAVGPISSNWDRAAELYYQIKGGCVDYGSRSGARYAHAGALRQEAPKCWAADAADNPGLYPLALYPAWDARHPIHLIGHSAGGNTIRALVELLEHGAPGSAGDLYAGGKIGWVSSVTTISAPHNGTTLSDAVLDFGPLMSAWSGHIEMMAMGGSPSIASAPSLWQAPAGVDPQQWELAPDGAREFNLWARTSPNVYYYSIATLATEAGSYCCNQTDRIIAPIQEAAYQYPRADMMFFFKPAAGEWIAPLRLQHGMGSYTQSAPGRVRIDSDWFANDGVVNTNSMKAPAGHPVRNYDGVSVRGVWNFLRTYKGYDHFDVLGWPNPGPSAYPVYDQIGAIIYGL